MITLVQLIQEFSNSDGTLVVPEDKTAMFEEALNGINRKSMKEKKKQKKKVKDPNAPKRPTSAYMIWLNKNRKEIKEIHFGDFDSITNWSLDEKVKYYETKGLDIPTEDGKPRVVALVTSKAGLLWKELSDDDRMPYDQMFKEAQEKYATLKETYVPKDKTLEIKIPDDWSGPHMNLSIKNTIKDSDGKTIKLFETFGEALEQANELDTQCFGITQTKRGFSVRIGKMDKCSKSIASWTKNDFVNPVKSGRGRPKTKVEDSDDEDIIESPDVEDGLEVEELIVDGTTYFYDDKTNDVYDPETSELVGKYVDGSIV